MEHQMYMLRNVKEFVFMFFLRMRNYRSEVVIWKRVDLSCMIIASPCRFTVNGRCTVSFFNQEREYQS